MSRCLERDDSAAWNHLAECKMEPLPAITAGPCGGRGPTRAPDSGDYTSLWVVAPAPHHKIYKRTGRGAVRAFPVCWLFSVPAHRSWFLSTRPALCLTWNRQSAHSSTDSALLHDSPADSALLHWLVVGSTHLPDPVCHYTHSLLTPPFSTHWLLTPPKVLPSRLTVAPHSLDRRLAARSATKQETMRQLSGRYRPVEHPPTTCWVVWSVNRARY